MTGMVYLEIVMLKKSLEKKCGPGCEPHFPKQTTKPVIKKSLLTIEI
jgi:hypothetical protein